MSTVRPFVSIVLGDPASADADRLAAAAGATGAFDPGRPDPGDGPQIAVVIDPAQAQDPSELRNVVHRLMHELDYLSPAPPDVCVVASHPVTDTLKIVDGAQVLLGTADRDDYRWVSGPVAGPLAVLAAAAGHTAGTGELLTALIEHGQRVMAVRAG